MKYIFLCFTVFVCFQALLAQVLSVPEEGDPFSRAYARVRFAVMLDYGINEDFISYAFTINSDQVPGVSGSQRVGSIGRYEKVMVSENQIIVRAWIAGTTAIVAELLTEVTEAVDYTMILRRKSDGFWIKKVVDDNSLVGAGQMRIRVIHNSYEVNSVLSLTEGTSIFATTVLIPEVAPGDISGYHTMESGTHTLALTANPGQSSPTQLPSVVYGNRASFTIWVLGNPTSTNPLNTFRTIVSLDYQPTDTQFPIPPTRNARTGQARIRFVSVCSSVANAQFQLGLLPVHSLDYGEYSDYMVVSQGRNAYSIFHTGERFVAVGALYLTQNHDYTLYLRMRLDGIPEAHLVEDYSYVPPMGYSNVRWVNQMNVIAPSVDLTIEFHKFVDNLKFSGVSRYLPIDVNSPPMYGTLRMHEHTGDRRILAVVPKFRSWFFSEQSYTIIIAGDSIAPKFIVMHEDGSNREANAEGVSNDFDDMIEESLRQMNVTVGVSGAIGQHRANQSAVVWAKSYGWAQKEHKNRNTRNTMFLVGASGDVIISYLTFLKIREGEIDMDASIEPTVGFRVFNPNTGKSFVTWSELLTHTSGIADNVDMYLRVLTYNGDSNVGNCEFVREYLSLGGRYFSEENYYSEEELTSSESNFKFAHMNYALISCALEKMTDRTFADLAYEKVFHEADHLSPEGLRRTTYFYSDLPNFRRSSYNYMPRYKMMKNMNMHMDMSHMNMSMDMDMNMNMNMNMNMSMDNAQELPPLGQNGPMDMMNCSMVNGSMMMMMNGTMMPCMNHGCMMINGSMMMMRNGTMMPCMDHDCMMVNGSMMMMRNGTMMPCMHHDCMMVNGSMMMMRNGTMMPCMYHDCMMVNGSMMMMMNGTMMPCHPECMMMKNGSMMMMMMDGSMMPCPECQMINGSMMMMMNGTWWPCPMMKSYWVPVRRAALPIYPAFGLQSTPSDLVSIMTYIAKHHTEVFDMMTEETNITDHGHRITRGGAHVQTLSDGNDIYGWPSWSVFGHEEIMEFSITAYVVYSKVQELAVSFAANTLFDSKIMTMWIEKALLTVNAASMIAEYGPRRNCQSYVTEDICEIGSECKWIKPLTVQAAGGICVKSVAVAVKIVHPSAHLSPLNLRNF